MMDLINKYQDLPDEVREEISTPDVMSAINQIEGQYKVDLATLIMKVMTKEMPLAKMPSFFAIEYNFSKDQANEISKKIKERVLKNVIDYLSTKNEQVEKNLSDKPTEARIGKQSANFFFSPEDESEIRNILEKINDSTDTNADNEKNKRIDKVIAVTGTVFSSILMEERFYQVLLSYLRGVRNKIETVETLVRHHSLGGLNMDRDSAERIIKLLESNDDLLSTPSITMDNRQPTKNFQSNFFQSVPSRADILTKLQNTGMRDFEYDLAKELEKKKAEQERIKQIIQETGWPKQTQAQSSVSGIKQAEFVIPSAKNEDTMDATDVFLEELHLDHELMPPASPKIMSIKPQMVKPDISPAFIDKEKPTVEITKEPAKKIDFIRPVNVDGKIKMEDVKYVPHFLDPIDELRFFNAVNFRRLSKDPYEATAKINSKIELLKKEKFSKGIEAIKAWRESSINKLYIEMGNDCIENQLPIEEVINRRQQGEKEYLSIREFEAIMDLNKSLRF